MADFVYPSGWTDIANQALSHLGSKRITNLIDGSALATTCQQFMGRAVEDVLAITDWCQATRRAILNRLVETPPFGFSYYYQMPVDYIRMLQAQQSVYVEGATWAIEGDRMITDAETAYLRYIARPADPAGPAKMPGYLRQLIEVWLAVLMSIPLSASDERKALIMALWGQKKGEALTADAAERHQETAKEQSGFTWWDELRKG